MARRIDRGFIWVAHHRKLRRVVQEVVEPRQSDQLGDERREHHGQQRRRHQDDGGRNAQARQQNPIAVKAHSSGGNSPGRRHQLQ